MLFFSPFDSYSRAGAPLVPGKSATVSRIVQSLPVDPMEAVEVLERQVEIERLLQGVQALISAGHPDDAVMHDRIAQMQACARNISVYNHELEEFKAVSQSSEP